MVPPVQTNNDTYTVAFFDFGSCADATAFYMSPPLDAHLIVYGIQMFQSLPGDTGVPAPSRGLDLRECLWAGGPGQGGATGRGTPSGGDLDSSGGCNVGSPSSIGVATIIQRGLVVLLVESFNTTVVAASAAAAELSETTPFANRALDLLHSVGLAGWLTGLGVGQQRD